MDRNWRLLEVIERALRNEPEISDLSWDGDNQDAELIFTFEGQEYVLSSRALQALLEDRALDQETQ